MRKLVSIRKATQTEEGATIVEFALVASFMFLLVGVIIDLGLGIHSYMLLRHVTAESTRAAAIQLNTHADCGTVENYLSNEATPHLSSMLTAAGGEDPQWCMRWKQAVGAGASAFPVLSIEGSVPTRCFFLCTLFPEGWRLSSTSEAVIERRFVDCQAAQFGCGV